MVSPELSLLGRFQLEPGSGPPPRKNAQARLAYLADRGQAQPRDKLATLLWSEMDDEQARAKLRETLFVPRTSLSAARLSLRVEDEASA
jgi:DNA-binding SARP family transcriptional activator